MPRGTPARRTRWPPGSDIGRAGPSVGGKSAHGREHHDQHRPSRSGRRRHGQTDGIRLPRRRRSRRHPQHRARGHGRQARAVPGVGRCRAAIARGSRRAHRDRRAVRPGVAQRTGGGRIRQLRPRQRPLHAPARAGRRAHRRLQPGVPAGLLPDRPRLGAGLAAYHRRDASGAGYRLGRARARRPRGLRAVLPTRLQRQPASPTWLPALDGVVAKLEAGRQVADVGCGHGASTDPDGAGVPGLARSSGPTTTTARSRPPAGRRASCGVRSGCASRPPPRRPTVVLATTS